jgi:hypothetical protein
MADANTLTESAMRRDRLNSFVTVLGFNSVEFIEDKAPATEAELKTLELVLSELQSVVEKVERLIMDAPSFVEECPAAPGEEGYVEEVA